MVKYIAENIRLSFTAEWELKSKFNQNRHFEIFFKREELQKPILALISKTTVMWGRSGSLCAEIAWRERSITNHQEKYIDTSKYCKNLTLDYLCCGYMAILKHKIDKFNNRKKIALGERLFCSGQSISFINSWPKSKSLICHSLAM